MMLRLALREVGWKGETEIGRKHYDGATEISRMEGIQSSALHQTEAHRFRHHTSGRRNRQ